MELTYDKIEECLEYISAGCKVIDVIGRILLFKQPSNLIKMMARRIYASEYEKAINEEGLLSNEDMSELIERRGLIKQEDVDRKDSLLSRLEAQNIVLKKTTRVRANKERVLGIISKLESELLELELGERSRYAMTAETRAEESKVLYLCRSCCYDFYTNELIWPDESSFGNETNLVLRQIVVGEFAQFFGGLNTSEIRALARSNLWRIKYVTSLKTSDSLFGISASNYSNDMLNLVYWSHFYQNVFDMMPEDRPPDDIIEDDEALDAYLGDIYEEKKRESVVRKDKKRGGRLSAFDKDEVIVTKIANQDVYDDITFDEPREAKGIKDRALIQKKTRRN